MNHPDNSNPFPGSFVNYQVIACLCSALECLTAVVLTDSLQASWTLHRVTLGERTLVEYEVKSATLCLTSILHV